MPGLRTAPHKMPLASAKKIPRLIKKLARPLLPGVQAQQQSRSSSGSSAVDGDHSNTNSDGNGDVEAPSPPPNDGTNLDYWGCASDTLACPALVGLSFRAVWMACAIVLAVSSSSVVVFASLSAAVHFLGVLLFALLLAATLSGTLLGGLGKRNVRVVRVASCLLPLHVIELGLAVWGYILINDVHPSMTKAQFRLQHAILIGMVVNISVFFFFSACALACCHRAARDVRSTERSLLSCCRCAQATTCNLFGGARGAGVSSALSEIAEMLESFFSDVDLVSSDIVATLLLIKAEQNASGTPSLGNALSPEAAHCRDDLKEAAHYSGAMMGVYGWKLFVYMSPFTGLFRLLFSAIFRPPHPKAAFAYGSRRNLNAIALQQRLLPSQQLLFFSLRSRSGAQIPYAIIADHDKRTVGIFCRGTLTFDDCLTDLMALPVPLDNVGRRYGFDGVDKYAHSGFLNVATWICDDIAEKGILRNALSSPESKLKDYQLIVSGHSLGAAAASVVSLLLKSEYPSLRCILYSPPGCIFDARLAEEVSAWTFGLFLGKDVIPRLSWHSMLTLKAKMLEAMLRSRVNKTQALKIAVKAPPSVDSVMSPDIAQYCASDDPIAASTAALYEQAIKDTTDMAHSEKLAHLCLDVQMACPGRLVHLAKTTATTAAPFPLCCCACRKTRTYAPVPVDDRSALGQILVSKNMLFDHFPNRCARILEEITR